MDIRDYAAIETHTFDVLDLDDSTPIINPETKRPFRITVYGPGSTPYTAAKARQQAKALAKLAKGKDMSLVGDEQRASNAEFLADITESTDLTYGDLKGREMLVAMYGDASLGFIAEAVNKKATDWANFKRGSVTA